MLQALCLSDIGIGWLQSAGSCLRCCRAALAMSPTRRAAAAAAAHDQRRASACHRYPLPAFAIFSPSLPVARLTACVRAGTVKVQRCCIDHTHTHTQSVPGAVPSGTHLTLQCVRAYTYDRRRTTPHGTAPRRCGRPAGRPLYLLSLRPLGSSHVNMQPTNRTRQK